MLRSPLTSLILAVAFAIGVAAVPASAAPQPAAACSSPTLSGPSAVRVGDGYVVSGCGFDSGSMVGIEVTSGGGCCLALQVAADGSGWVFYRDTASSGGTYRVRATQRVRNRVRVVAEWSFTAS